MPPDRSYSTRLNIPPPPPPPFSTLLFLPPPPPHPHHPSTVHLLPPLPPLGPPSQVPSSTTHQLSRYLREDLDLTFHPHPQPLTPITPTLNVIQYYVVL
jgi:hypothetical protein